MGTAKKPPKAPTGRILRTAEEVLRALPEIERRLERARVLRLLEYCEVRCQEIVAQPPTDPRQPSVARMRALVGRARDHLARGQVSYRDVVDILALANRMNRLFLEPRAAHAKVLRDGRKPGSHGALRGVLEAYEADHPAASNAASWEHLRALASRDDDTIHEVLEGGEGCHPGAHVHWRVGDRLKSTSKDSVARLMRKIRSAPAA